MEVPIPQCWILIDILANSYESPTDEQYSSWTLQVEVSIVDVSTSRKETKSIADFAFVTRKEVLSYYLKAEELSSSSYLLPDDRGEAVKIMSKALEDFLKKNYDDGVLCGAVGIGGSGGTSLISPALRSLPLGVPKLIVSTVG